MNGNKNKLPDMSALVGDTIDQSLSTSRELSNSGEILELEGYKIVDNSFICSAKELGSERNVEDQINDMDRELKAILFLEYNAEDFLFSKEFLEEFYFGIRSSVGLSQGLKSFESGRYRIKFRQLRDSKMNFSGNVHKKFGDIILKRKRALNGAFLYYPLEFYIPEGSDWESCILPAVLHVGSLRGIKKDSDRGGLEMFRQNDERIFAKAVELSKQKPVFILTGDRDFIRMRDRYYMLESELMKKYGFEQPEHGVDIVYFSSRRRGYFLLQD